MRLLKKKYIFYLLHLNYHHNSITVNSEWNCQLAGRGGCVFFLEIIAEKEGCPCIQWLHSRVGPYPCVNFGRKCYQTAEPVSEIFSRPEFYFLLDLSVRFGHMNHCCGVKNWHWTASRIVEGQSLTRPTDKLPEIVCWTGTFHTGTCSGGRPSEKLALHVFAGRSYVYPVEAKT